MRQPGTPPAWHHDPNWRRWIEQLFRRTARARYALKIQGPLIAQVNTRQKRLFLNPDLIPLGTGPYRFDGADNHERLTRLLRALTCHEAGHVQFSDLKPAGAFGELWNALEDERIERCMIRRHPELYADFTFIGDVMLERAGNTNALTLSRACHLWRWAHDRPEIPFSTQNDELWEQELRPRVEAAWESSRQDLMQLTREIFELLPPEEQQDSPLEQQQDEVRPSASGSGNNEHQPEERSTRKPQTRKQTAEPGSDRERDQNDSSPESSKTAGDTGVTEQPDPDSSDRNEAGTQPDSAAAQEQPAKPSPDNGPEQEPDSGDTGVTGSESAEDGDTPGGEEGDEPGDTDSGDTDSGDTGVTGSESAGNGDTPGGGESKQQTDSPTSGNSAGNMGIATAADQEGQEAAADPFAGLWASVKQDPDQPQEAAEAQLSDHDLRDEGRPPDGDDLEEADTDPEAGKDGDTGVTEHSGEKDADETPLPEEPQDVDPDEELDWSEGGVIDRETEYSGAPLPGPPQRTEINEDPIKEVERPARLLSSILAPPTAPGGKRPHRTKGRYSYSRHQQGYERYFEHKRSEEKPDTYLLKLAIDISGSMKGRALAAAQKAALMVVRAAELAQARTDLLAFNDQPFSVGEFHAPPKEKYAAILKLRASGGTSVHSALQYLLIPSARPGEQEILVIISDGDIGGLDEFRCKTLMEGETRMVLPVLIGDAADSKANWERVFGQAQAAEHLDDISRIIRRRIERHRLQEFR